MVIRNNTFSHMKKLLKVFVAFLLSAVLFCGNQQKAHAQFVVSDPGSLIQMILDYLQEADMEGIFTDVSRLTASTEQLQNLRDRLEQLQGMVTFVQGALQVSSDLKALVDISQAFAASVDKLTTIASFLAQNDQGFNVGIAAMNYLADYKDVFKEFLEQAKSTFSQVMTLQKSEALDFLHSVRSLAEDFYVEFEAVSRHYEMKMMALYYRWNRIEAAVANEAFLAITIY